MGSNDGILSLKWKDKRDVLMLTTYHDSSMVQSLGGREQLKVVLRSLQSPMLLMTTINYEYGRSGQE